jgi:hypothetical protein
MEAFETLFNKRDDRNALNFWSPKYNQVIVAEGVPNWVVVDIVRMVNGVLAAPHRCRIRVDASPICDP